MCTAPRKTRRWNSHSLSDCMFHIAMEASVAHRRVAASKIVETYLAPFVARHRQENVHDGTGPTYAPQQPDIDRLLYVYDAVFDRPFRDTRVRSTPTRELTLKLVRILDSYVELDEMKDFFKIRHLSKLLCTSNCPRLVNGLTLVGSR